MIDLEPEPAGERLDLERIETAVADLDHHMLAHRNAVDRDMDIACMGLLLVDIAEVCVGDAQVGEMGVDRKAARLPRTSCACAWLARPYQQ
jgi:hypothetical protein